jgi:hypothetical protein|uniref:Uncharacterized protein n=1 Tax=Vicia faba TaxID=3906 RepID=R4IV59_VICFA|nr:hypothetical protein [Vicia faba]AGC79033.1 hypothetical protein [Vicia faba]
MTPPLEKTTYLSTSHSTRKRRMHHLRGPLEQELAVKLAGPSVGFGKQGFVGRWMVRERNFPNDLRRGLGTVSNFPRWYITGSTLTLSLTLCSTSRASFKFDHRRKQSSIASLPFKTKGYSFLSLQLE